MYGLDTADFLSATRLAWQTCLNKTKIELELLTDIGMLQMVERSVRAGMCHAVHRYTKANT